jgi:hypothetical protein
MKSIIYYFIVKENGNLKINYHIYLIISFLIIFFYNLIKLVLGLICKAYLKLLIIMYK